MKIYLLLEKIFNWLIDSFWILFVKIHEYINIKKKKKLYKKVTLTKAQKQLIDDFYKENYGKKIPYKWHQLYTSYTGKFDYKFIPEFIYTTRLEPKSNKRRLVHSFENKNILDSLMTGLTDTPKNILKCDNGIFLDTENGIINQDNVNQYLKDNLLEGVKYICKPTIETGSGIGVCLLDGRGLNQSKLMKQL